MEPPIRSPRTPRTRSTTSSRAARGSPRVATSARWRRVTCCSCRRGRSTASTRSRSASPCWSPSPRRRAESHETLASGTDVSPLGYTRLRMSGPIRVVVAKPGLDGHDRGAKIIARTLRDAGMEVIYTGLHQTPEQIVETALQEDADAIGISILSGAHMTLIPRILELLRDNDAEDVLVVVGGTIPADDADDLKKQGVAEVFGPGAATGDIIDFIRGSVGGSR